MNLMICFVGKSRGQRKISSDHSVPVLMKDHGGRNVACRLKHDLRRLIIAAGCSFDLTHYFIQETNSKIIIIGRNFTISST